MLKVCFTSVKNRPKVGCVEFRCIIDFSTQGNNKKPNKWRLSIQFNEQSKGMHRKAQEDHNVLWITARFFQD